MTRRAALTALLVAPVLATRALAARAAEAATRLGSGAGARVAGVDVSLPRRANSVRLLIIGDSGTGGRAQQEVADRIVACHAQFPFDTALMLGDNLYGRQRPRDFDRKFAQPYKPLLDAGVRFYAALGNHDDAVRQCAYEPFNMGGARYYTFARGDVRFFALDSTQVDRAHLDWLRRELAAAREPWKICYAHHPLYSTGARHGSELSLRRALEPLFVEHDVSAVFAGHDHFYQRLVPQQGIYYFVNGGAAKLRKGDIRPGPSVAAGFDRDRSFMLVEIAGDELFYQAIARTGETVDAGSFACVKRPALTQA